MFPIRANQSLASTDTRTAIGRAPSSWNVLVAGVAASRIDEVFYRPLTASNSTSPVWQDVVVQRDTGSPTTTQHFWYAPQSVTPVHDFDGNLTDDGRWVYSWDAENRLVQMETTTQATAAGHPYTKLQFVYDWQGRRIARHVWQGGTQASPTFKSSHRWLYDGWNVITEFTATSATEQLPTRANTFTWGLDLSGTLQGAGGVGGLLVQTAVSGSVTERTSYDGNGNIVAWTKSSASAPTSRREYDAFGNTLVSEGAAPSTFGFSTKMQDTETGLYYYGYRFYDPVTGRWPSRDPIGEKGGVNLLAFVANKPLRFIDRLGLVGVNTDEVKLDVKKAAQWSDKVDGINSFADMEKKAKFALWGNTDRTVVVQCECGKDDSGNCVINCKVIAMAKIYLNQNRSKEKSKDEWTKAYGHEQQHIKSLQAYLDETFIPELKKEPNNPCTAEHADDIAKNYNKKFREWKKSGGDHKGDPNATSKSPGWDETMAPEEGSPEVPTPPGGFKS